MDSMKQHAVCVPFPAQGHINPMLKLAKLLHHRGFHITFVNTEYNHRRLLRSRGPNSLDGLPSFQFKTIPDGLPWSDEDSTQDGPSLCDSTSKFCLTPFRSLLFKLNEDDDTPRVTCIVSDCIAGFTLPAAEELDVPEVLFWTASASGFMACLHYRDLIEKGFSPLKDASYLTNGYLDTVIDFIPGMKDIRFKDLPSFIRTTDPNDIMVNFASTEVQRAHKASALIFNTFETLEHEVLSELSALVPVVYNIGPLQLLLNEIPENEEIHSIGSNLWKDERECLAWLDSKEPNSVVYVNFGSITVMTPQQLVEFAWGLANSNMTFLWIIRPDLVMGDSAIVPPAFVKETKERSILAGWCPQEQVLTHSSIGGFLTHNGWNSTIESLTGGVPMICWPFFADQQTNCWYCCTKWGVGMEIDNTVRRDEVEKLVRDLMVGEKAKEMKKMAMNWKEKAQEATSNSPPGSSYIDFENLISDVLLSKNSQ